MSKEKLSVVVFSAHAGDLENTAGGTIANYARRGHHVTVVHLTGGEKGNAALSTEEYLSRKREAANRAADILGCETHIAGWPDAELPVGDAVQKYICDIIRKARADIVITHWKGSFHKDHVNTFLNVKQAVFLACLPGYKTEHSAHEVKSIYFAENWEDMEGFTPDTYIDISDTVDLKLRASAEYHQHHIAGGFEYTDYYRSLARMRGCYSGRYEYAEAFMTPSMGRVSMGVVFPGERVGDGTAMFE